MSERLRIAVFASHGGSNLQALIDACEAGRIDGEVVLVVSNNRKAYALERARNHGIATLPIRQSDFATAEAYERELVEHLKRRNVNLICLAGYMKMIPKSVLDEWRHRIINIHPALLPKFGGSGMYGIHVHEAVLRAGETVSGATVHLVDEIYDHGRILAQREVPVYSDDTPESLQARVLEVEHQLYPETVARIARGELKLE